ncbi:MAG: nuclear transport factor 2 family protein [Acidimicrobiales bacterium]
MPNQDIVARMYELFGTGDMETIKTEVFHPDITWHMPGHHPLSGDMHGADAVIGFFGALFQSGIRVDNAHFGELDDGTVIERHMGHGQIGDEEIPLPTCTSYEIVDGKLHSVQVHSAVQHDVDRLMWARINLKDIPARLA